MANFQFISKNNIGCVVALLFVILLSQSKVFNILLDTVLGRIILIAFLLIISYLKKILGVISVLFIIIIFNNSSIGHMEGFTTDASNNVVPPTPNVSSTTSSTTSSTPSVKPPVKPSAISRTSSTSSSVSPTPPVPTTTSSTTSSTTSTPLANASTTATEGFDIIGKEGIIKRGKQSNSIPVTDFMRESTSVAPYEGSSYLESFSAF